MAETKAPCELADCGLLHDDDGHHAEKGWARGARRALHHHAGECPAYGGVQHRAADCPLLTADEIAEIRKAADAAIRRDSFPKV